MSEKLSTKIRLESLKLVIKNEFNMAIKNPAVDLIIDSGSENNRHIVLYFIKNAQAKINKKTVMFSLTYCNIKT